MWSAVCRCSLSAGYGNFNTSVDIYNTSAAGRAERYPSTPRLTCQTHTLSQISSQQSHGTPLYVPRAPGLWGTESPVTLWPTRWLQAVWAHNTAQTDTLPTRSAVVQNDMLPWRQGVMSQRLLEKGQWECLFSKTFIRAAFNAVTVRKCKSPDIFLYCSFLLKGTNHQPLHSEDYTYRVPQRTLANLWGPPDLGPQKDTRAIFPSLQWDTFHQGTETGSQRTVTRGQEEIRVCEHVTAGT